MGVLHYALYDSQAAAEDAAARLAAAGIEPGQIVILSAGRAAGEAERHVGSFADTEGHIEHAERQPKGRYDEGLSDPNAPEHGRVGRFDDTSGHIHDARFEPKGSFADGMRQALQEGRLTALLAQTGLAEADARRVEERLEAGAVLVAVDADEAHAMQAAEILTPAR